MITPSKISYTKLSDTSRIVKIIAPKAMPMNNKDGKGQVRTIKNPIK